MSEDENLLARWSARKLASRAPAASEAPAQQGPRDDSEAAAHAVAETAGDTGTPADEPFDPAQLPPLDSIGPDTDVSAFLRRDVPPDLTRAALRRAWTSDPAIKDFVGLVENGWDFNDPAAMPGFGSISPEEVARLAGNIFAGLPEVTPASEAKQVSTSTTSEPDACPTAKLEAQPELGRDPADRAGTANDAAQQNETGEKS